MEFEKAIQKLKGHIQDYAEEILTKSKGKDQYECIFCGSGTGSNGTGALTIYQDSFYCFSCRKSGDIFDLIQQAEGISKNKVIQYAAKKYGVDIDNISEKEENVDYTAFYRECNKHLQEKKMLIIPHFIGNVTSICRIQTITGGFPLIRLIAFLSVMLHNGSTRNLRIHRRHQD